MIEVKIGSVLGRRGVEGVRWVLLDPQEPPPTDRLGRPGQAAARAADAAAAQTAQRSADAVMSLHRHALADRAPQQRLLLTGLKLLLSLAMLGLAVWAASQHLGRPGQAGSDGLSPASPQPMPLPASSPVPGPTRPLITTQA